MWAGTSNTAGGGESLWKFVSGGGGLIDLKTAAGVTGIAATLPADTKMGLVLQDAGFMKQAIHAYFDAGVEVWYSGILKLGAQIAAVTAYTNLMTQAQREWSAGKNEISGHAALADKLYLLVIDELSLVETLGDTGTGNGAYRDMSETEQELNVQVALNVVSRLLLNVTNNRLEKFTANGAMFITQVENGGGGGAADLIEMLLQDNGTGDNVSVSAYKDYAFLQYTDSPLGANDRMQVKARIDKMSVDFNDAIQFAVKKDGKIQTNQLTAVVPVIVPDTTLTLYDLAGNAYIVAAQKL